MPKVKSEKRSVAHAADGEAKKGSGWSGGQLFGSETTELTFQGAGFKDKDKALETIKLLDGRDISFQFQIINSMYHRAKVILKRTKDAEKVQNLTEAVETFETWLNDYRAHSRAKENFTYLPLEVVEGYDKLAERYGIKGPENGTPSFLQVYKAAEGDLKKLRVLKVDKDDESSVTWDVNRNRNLKSVSERIRLDHLPLYETDQEYRGLPSKEHVEMIMWGYSPELTKVKKAMAQIDEKLNAPSPPAAEPITDAVDNMVTDDIVTNKIVADKMVTEEAVADKTVAENGTNSDSE
ncbi:hypothetical protein PR048_024454 [Dryococelus australis]|uniref:Uncharacterized protein n=1 Tax=Dryococelus australis TaxID=614101 RepID=A0ABQ9GNL5_9NEOP|nr:hypothetical protein PR048_024454 [Dryococelus australis]